MFEDIFIQQPDMDIDIRQLKAMRNVILLARERVWLANDRPIIQDSDSRYYDCNDHMDTDAINTAETSLDVMEQLFNQLAHAKKKNYTQETQS